MIVAVGLGIFQYLERAVFSAWILYMIISLIGLASRLRAMSWKYGFSAKLLLAVSSEIYASIIPWASLKKELREHKAAMSEENERLIASIQKMDSKFDLFIVERMKETFASNPAPMGPLAL